MTSTSLQAIVLAAGKSTRFNTKKSKQLAPICGKPMILYPLNCLKQLAIATTIVVGQQADDIIHTIQADGMTNVQVAVQHEQKGTGHALGIAQPQWTADNIIVLNGDTPLITTTLLDDLITAHAARGATVTFYATHVIDPTGYGRIVAHNNDVRIVEEKDCTTEQRGITHVNAAVYIFKRSFLETYINRITPSPVTGEYYLPELINMAHDDGLHVEVLSAPFDEVRGVNTLEELWAVEQVKRANIIKYWMARGVRFELAHNIHIDVECEIGSDSFIGSGVLLLNGTKIGKNCFIGAYSIIKNSTVKDDTTIHSHTVVEDSVIGNNVVVGPFARLRHNVVVGDSAVIGNFVEMKNSTLGTHSKAKHLSYLGDATIGTAVNIGAGTITCNSDGSTKHPTTINDNAYIGAHNALVAPVTIGDGAFTAAGSTITHDVPAQSLAIARSRQINKEGYAEKLRSATGTSHNECDHEEACSSKTKQFMGALSSLREPQQET
jgi:bifunctional UDP-N-acetylglucosamine pyrophosphorylase/glucosamine-1-phosphate N-acetyltransferase